MLHGFGVRDGRAAEREIRWTDRSFEQYTSIMARITVDQLLEIPPAERVKLAQELWDSVAQNPDQVALTREQREELDRRLEAIEKNPNAGSSWDSIKKTFRGE